MKHCPKFKKQRFYRNGSWHPKGSPLLPRRDRTPRRRIRTIGKIAWRCLSVAVGAGYVGVGIGWDKAIRFVEWSGRIFDVREIIDTLSKVGLS